mgnify:FL=1
MLRAPGAEQGKPTIDPPASSATFNQCAQSPSGASFKHSPHRSSCTARRRMRPASENALLWEPVELVAHDDPTEPVRCRLVGGRLSPVMLRAMRGSGVAKRWAQDQQLISSTWSSARVDVAPIPDTRPCLLRWSVGVGALFNVASKHRKRRRPYQQDTTSTTKIRKPPAGARGHAAPTAPLAVPPSTLLVLDSKRARALSCAYPQRVIEDIKNPRSRKCWHVPPVLPLPWPTSNSIRL